MEEINVNVRGGHAVQISFVDEVVAAMARSL